MKKMKKITAALIAVSISISSFAVAHASRMSEIDSAAANGEISILYNSTVVTYEDVKPVNTDGRVMIPFRAALESMGAEIEYSEADKKVTAVKGDTQISFTLMDDTIYIDNGGETSTITMDVPMMVVDGRTLVPIRFMSNALGMQVGWDGATQTVMIVDYDECFKNLEEIMPNLMKIQEISNRELELNKDGVELTLNAKGPEEEEISFAISMNAITKDEKMGADGTVSLSGSDFSVENASFDVVLDGTMLYFKTDLFEKAAGMNGEFAALLLSGLSGEWFSVDIAEYSPAETLEIIKMAATNQTPDPGEVFKKLLKSEDDAVLSEVKALAAMFDVYEAMDRKIVIEEKDGAYAFSFTFTDEDLGEDFTEEVKLNISMKGESGKDKETAEAVISAESEDVSVKMTVNAVSEMAAEDETVTVPENATNFVDFLAAMAQ